ncbi:unnamed protein product [Alternaria alternata]
MPKKGSIRSILKPKKVAWITICRRKSSLLSETESNAAFRLDYSDSESTLSNPPDSTDLDTIGANLLMEEMNRNIPVLKNGGRELIDNSALVSEEAYPSKKENSVSASLPDDDGTESHLIITDATREEAARFGCTTDSQILDFMESIDRPEKREGGRFLTPKSRKDRKGNSSGSSTSSAVMFSPVQAPAQQSMPKKRYNGPVSFNLDEGDVQPRLKPAPPMTKNLLEKMADFNSDPVKRAALQDMANKVGDTSKIPSPAWKSPVATNNSPFASKFQGASNSPRLSKSNSTSPSPYPRPSISSGGYDSIRASSLPFDPSKPRPSNNDRIYVDEGNEDDECCDGNDSYHDDNDGDVPQEEATLIIPRENSQPNDQAGQLRDGE